MRLRPLALALALVPSAAHPASSAPLPSLPPLPPARPAPADVSPARAALVGAWVGEASDGLPTVAVVPEVQADGARLLLVHGDRTDERGDAWHAWVDVPWGPSPAAALAWELEGRPAALQLDGAGAVQVRFWHGPSEVTGVLRRAPYPAHATLGECAGPPDLRSIAGLSTFAERAAAVEALVLRSRQRGAPLVETGGAAGRGCATWLYRGKATEVLLAGDMNGWHAPEHPLQRVADTDLFALSLELPAAARLDYKLVVDGAWLLDPLDPRTMPGGYGPNSELAMPGYRSPPEVARRPDVPRGRFEELPLPAGGRVVGARVYLPPGYDAGGGRYPVLYVHDGMDAVTLGALDVVLDNLIADRRLSPVIAVFATPRDRVQDYALDPAPFESAFLKILVPAVDARYRTVVSPAGRAVAGISLGGLAALSLALGHPECFGGCVAQSPSVRFRQFEALRALARTAAPRPAVYLDAGRFDADLHGWDLLAQTRRMHRALAELGYRLRYQEPDEGHSWGSWRARFADALPFVLGSPGAATEVR